ncbi:YihY/virulence factor BrkB family protein [Gammaproteobacteria bacterium]|nr:YihY/virulence factor BrkB family protein [Gammaproteobacteria bacterium]
MNTQLNHNKSKKSPSSTDSRLKRLADRMSRYLTDIPSKLHPHGFAYFVQVFYQFLVVGIFRITEDTRSKGARFIIRTLKTLILSIRGFMSDTLVMKASGLAYYTVMAVVPILALITSIGRGFGFQKTVETFIYDNVGNHEIAEYLMGFVTNYLDYASGGIFVGIGIAILMWVAISMFRFIESNLNKIWNVKKSRSFARQVTTYISILILVPLLIVVSSSLSVIVNNYVEVLSATRVGSFFFPLYRFMLYLLPYMIYWLLFSLLYIILPNTKVKFSSALVAGIVAGTGVMILIKLYVSGQVGLARYNAIYGSVAAIPMLMFMVQLIWYVVLYGAELSYVRQNLEHFSFEKDTDNISPRYKDYSTVLVMHYLIKQFEMNIEPPTAMEISKYYNLPIRLTQNILKQLVDVQLVNEIFQDKLTDKSYQIALDINQISLETLFTRLENHGSEAFLFKEIPETRHLWNVMQELNLNYNDLRSEKLIKDL